MNDFKKYAVILLLTCLSLSWSAPVNESLLIRPRQRRVIGGQESNKTFFTALSQGTVGNGEWTECTATVISPRHILTAAHCHLISNKDFTQNVETTEHYVLLANGKKNISDFDRVNVVAFHVYKDYNVTIAAHDIAILEIDPRNLTLSTVQIASNFNETLDDVNTIALGYGDYNVDPKNVTTLREADTLREVPLMTHSYSQCKKNWPLVQEDYHICVGEMGHNIASGDSGGPLLAEAGKGRWVQVGVASYGARSPTSQKPGVFGKLSSYCDWIKNVTENEAVCQEFEFGNYTITSSSRSTTIPICLWIIALLFLVFIHFQ